MFNGTVYLGSDHAGFVLKEYIEKKLTEAGVSVEDCGAPTLDPEDDYPDFVGPVADKVVSNPESRGIVFGKSGQGEAIEANRRKGVRAVVYYGGSTEIIKLSREHNDANILSLGAGFVGEEEAWEAVSLWLNTEFSNDPRHLRRISKLDN